jgi:HEPN domain-containing protein
MRPETAAWVAKAEADYISAGRELRARKCPNYDLACFLAQQSGEKYLKARLVEAGVAFPKIHSLTALLHLALPVEQSWTDLKPDAAQLSVYALEFRYPGKSADKALAQDAVRRANRIRKRVRRCLGLEAANARGASRKHRNHSGRNTSVRKRG